MTSTVNAATLQALRALKPSPTLPVLFLGQGSPMNAIDDNAWRRNWQSTGAVQLGAIANQAHPSHDPYLPLLYAAGAVRTNDMPRFFNVGVQAASISVRSAIWG